MSFDLHYNLTVRPSTLPGLDMIPMLRSHTALAISENSCEVSEYMLASAFIYPVRFFSFLFLAFLQQGQLTPRHNLPLLVNLVRMT